MATRNIYKQNTDIWGRLHDYQEAITKDKNTEEKILLKKNPNNKEIDQLEKIKYMEYFKVIWC